MVISSEEIIRESYIKFLTGYCVANHTVPLELVDKINKLAIDYVAKMKKSNIFTVYGLVEFLDFHIHKNLSSDELSYITPYLWKNRYNQMMNVKHPGIL